MSNHNSIRLNGAKIETSGRLHLLNIAIITLVFGAILFGISGRLDWWEAWICMAIFIVSGLVIGIWTIRHSPELVNERSHTWENAMTWDRVILVIYYPLLFSLFIIAGFDARYKWSSVPLGLQILGAVILICCFVMHYWVYSSNPYAATIVRIQAERGQVTITSGPYRYVRHPMYLGMTFLWWRTSLLLGCWWAMIPAFLCTVLFMIRIVFEERTLLAGLPEYAEYVQKVRYRLIPGIL